MECLGWAAESSFAVETGGLKTETTSIAFLWLASVDQDTRVHKVTLCRLCQLTQACRDQDAGLFNCGVDILVLAAAQALGPSHLTGWPQPELGRLHSN